MLYPDDTPQAEGKMMRTVSSTSEDLTYFAQENNTHSSVTTQFLSPPSPSRSTSEATL